jgi:hypothetical protein
MAIDEYKITDNTSTATLVSLVTSHWGNFSKTSGRTTTTIHKKDFLVVIKVWNFPL